MVFVRPIVLSSDVRVFGLTRVPSTQPCPHCNCRHQDYGGCIRLHPVTTSTCTVKPVLPILVPVDVRFYLDSATGEPHIWSHGVDEEEAEEVLRSPGEDRPGRHGSRVAIGQTASGRYLKVVYVRDPKPDSIFIITAYELRGKALLAYRRRQRRKHR